MLPDLAEKQQLAESLTALMLFIDAAYPHAQQ